jgi:hypothetical protein
MLPPNTARETIKDKEEKKLIKIRAVPIYCNKSEFKNYRAKSI